jgi:hypothetical protein
MKVIRRFSLLFVLVLAGSSWAQVLPANFAGWQRVAAAQKGTDPALVDRAFADVLKEYGFTDFETANYRRDDRTMKIKAARFTDATGAYGAFTFYRSPEMLTEKIGTMAASANNRVLFFRDNVLVDATLDSVTAMSGSELRELAASLPSATGAAANLPTLPGYFPRENMVANSAKFLIGPAALNAFATQSPLAPGEIDFSTNPEVLLGQYSARNGNGYVEVISYPTPTIAAEKAKQFEQTHRAGQGEPTFAVRRSGPLVAIARGTFDADTARSIVNGVNFQAEVTWNENTGLGKRDNIGNLVIAASVLAGVIFLISAATGVMFGGVRVLLHRFFPNTSLDPEKNREMIRLDLRD